MVKKKKEKVVEEAVEITQEQAEKEVVEKPVEDIEKNDEVDNTNAGDEIPTPEPEDNDAPEEEKVEEAPEQATKALEDALPLDAQPVVERKQDVAPVPEEGEAHDEFLHRYVNHPVTLRKIARVYRTAAAEKVWKDSHKQE